jgi:hypothetical protein
LNARDSIAAMDVKDAVRLVNYFCTPTDVVLRQGYTKRNTGLTGAVNSLMAYNAPAGTRKLFAGNGANIYDVTSSGAVGAAVVTGQTSDKYQHVQFGTAGGNYLYAVNGADKPRLYDGTTWTAIDGASTPAITGVTTTTLINVGLFKTRIWFVQKDTLLAWYLPSGSIGGAATSFDLRTIFKKGGYLVSIGNWTIDGGNGVDDYMVFITSEGEIAVYRGTDPSSITTFAIVGTFQVGNPIGYRCFEKYEGDLIIVTRAGLLPISTVLLSADVNTKSALTDKISSAISTLTNLYGSNYGWETQLYPQQNMLLFNIPLTSTSYQFAMNTITKSWSLFTGWNAYCFERFGEDVYFGGSDYVGKIYNDAKSDAGSNIVGDGLQAFSKFGTENNKFFKMAKPIIYTDGSPAINLAVNVNYDNSTPMGIATNTATLAGVWDSGLWDVAVWGGDALSQTWQTTGSIGQTGGLAIVVTTKTDTFKWEATQYVYEYANGTTL